MRNFIGSNFKAGRIKIHYYRTGGSKPPFILLHGVTDNGLCWTPIAKVLARQYDVIMPDAQGHGLSDRLDPDFHFVNHAAQVVALIKHLEITNPIIMGHSMGAVTAVNIAVEQPRLPKAIILEDPAWRAQEAIDSETNDESTKMRDAFTKMLTARTRKELIAECRIANPRWSEDEIIPWAEAKLQFDHTLLSNMELNSPTYIEIVPQIQCPTLLITSDGGIVSAEIARHVSKLWESKKPFRWVQINGAGHNIRREQFEKFMDSVACFLQEIS